MRQERFILMAFDCVKVRTRIWYCCLLQLTAVISDDVPIPEPNLEVGPASVFTTFFPLSPSQELRRLNVNGICVTLCESSPSVLLTVCTSRSSTRLHTISQSIYVCAYESYVYFGNSCRWRHSDNC